MKISANPIQACIDVLVSPSSAFIAVKEKKGWSWLPFILLVGTTVAVFMYYYSVVDFAWLKEQMINGMAASGKTDEEIAGFSDNFSVNVMKWATVIVSSVGIIVINLIVALYYHLITKVSAKNEFKFTDWYAFTWWVGMPAFVAMLVSALVIFFASNGQVTLQDIQPTSLNSLIFSVEQGSPWFNLLEEISLFSFWSIAIASIGISTWIKVDNQKAITIAAAPFVIIYGIWALYITFLA